MIGTRYDLAMASTRPADAESSDARGHLDNLGYLVKQAHRRLSTLADAALEPLGIDRREFGVLRILAGSRPLSQQGVAMDLGIDPTTMVGLIDALEAKGIVIRKPDPADRRRNAIELTTTGRTIYDGADAAYTAAEGAFLAPLSADGAEKFRQALRCLLAPDAGPETQH